MLVLICSLGFREATSGGIWPPLIPERNSGAFCSPLQQRRKPNKENAHVMDCVTCVLNLSFVIASIFFLKTNDALLASYSHITCE